MKEMEDRESRSNYDKFMSLFLRLILLVWGVTGYYGFFLSK